MQKKVNGNTEGIRDAVLERIAAIYDMTQGQYEFASHELIAELCALTGAIRREISVYKPQRQHRGRVRRGRV